jgi:hypothetical protein
MTDIRWPQQILESMPPTRKKRRRPRFGWIEGSQEAMDKGQWMEREEC